MGLISGAKAAMKRRVLDLIDEQITKKLTPFLEIGIGPDGEDCSDFVVDDHGDISIENMIVKTSLVSELLSGKGLPYRVRMVRCKRIYVDIPWSNMASGSWKLEVDGLMVVVTPIEKTAWSVDDVRRCPSTPSHSPALPGSASTPR